MNVTVFIEPHERHEAVEAYRERLSVQDSDQILDAPDGALIALHFGGPLGTLVQIFEEG